MKLIIPITILVIYLSYELCKAIIVAFDPNIQKARESIEKKQLDKYRKAYILSSRLTKNKNIKNIFERRQARLDQSGNVLKLTPLIYYVIKTISIITYIIVTIKVGFKPSLLICSLYLFFYVDLKYFFTNKRDQREIEKELPTIYNLLESMTYGDVPLNKSLLEVQTVVKNKRLKIAFIDLAAEIVAKKDILSALENFKAKFQSYEINSFCLTISQGIQTGKTREMLSNQRKILYKKLLGDKSIETYRSQFKVSLAMLLLFGSIGSISVFSFLNRIIENLKIFL